MQGTESGDALLAVICKGFSESCCCRHSGSRGKACKVLASQTDEGPKTLPQDLKMEEMEVDPTFITAPV